MKATALEVLSEPLSLLVLLMALILAVLTPALHYHQFGEPTRMARDAGLSSLFVCGGILAVFGAIRSLRREVESGTMAMALVHPISRQGFLAAKTLGVGVAWLAFSVIVAATMLMVVTGAGIGGDLALRTGDVARLWGPCFAGGVGVMVVPLVVSAAMNRFGRHRFVLTAFVLALILSVAGGTVAVFLRPALCGRLLPVAVLALVPDGVLMAAASALAVRFKANATAAGVGVVFLAFMPAVGNYYLADVLSKGGSVSWSYVGLAALAAVPVVLLFGLLGAYLVNRRNFS